MTREERLERIAALISIKLDALVKNPEDRRAFLVKQGLLK